MKKSYAVLQGTNRHFTKWVIKEASSKEDALIQLAKWFEGNGYEVINNPSDGETVQKRSPFFQKNIGISIPGFLVIPSDVFPFNFLNFPLQSVHFLVLLLRKYPFNHNSACLKD